MSKEDTFLTTRYIDIPPDITEDMKLAKKSVSPHGKRTGTVIRIAKSKHGTTPLGDADFQELLQNIYDAVLITDLKGKVINANVRAIQFLLQDAEELCRGNIVDLVSGADPALLASVWQTLQSDRFVLIQACCARKDGTIFPAEISVNHLVLSGHDYLSFFIRDVTLRKEAEEKLRTGYNAIQNSGGGIAIADAEANLQYCNPAIVRLLQFEKQEDLLGRNLREFFPGPGVVEEIAKAVITGGAWCQELEVRRRDESIIPVQITAAPNLNFDGEFAGIVLSLLDISNLKDAQTKLEEYAAQLRARNRQMEDDLKMAREVQLTCLPQEYPTFPRGASGDDQALRFSHLYLPSGAVGGDFFDILPLSDTQAGVFVADVVGHGMRAALVVATIRGLVEQLTPLAADPGPFLTQLNQAYAGIFRETGEVMFSTALYMVFDVRTGRIQYSSAGHLPAFRLRRSTGVAELMLTTDGAQGPALGLYEDSTYKHATCQLDVDDLILLYTDGLSETVGPAEEYYDSVHMPECLTKNISLAPDALLKEVVADAQRFGGREGFEDDVCLLGVEFRRLVQ